MPTVQFTDRTLYLNAIDQMKRAGLSILLNAESRGIDVPENIVPCLPEVDFNFQTRPGKHICEDEPVSPLLFVLVVPLVSIKDAHNRGASYTWGTDSFDPYWIWGHLVHYDHQIPAGFRDAYTVEVTCAMAQHQRYGSFLSYTGDWSASRNSRVEACFSSYWFGENNVGLHSNPDYRGMNHHRFVVDRRCHNVDQRMQIRK